MNKEEPKIENLSDLLTQLKDDLSPDITYWYRGHGISKWKLLPTLARDPSKLDYEADLIAKFQQSATLLLQPSPNSEWEWLTIMQHHSVPTRLLDWTESPLVGLFFAVEKHDDEPGALWVLNPIELNLCANIKHDLASYIPTFEDIDLHSYKASVLQSEKASHLNPAAVIGRRNTPRMQAQLGVHTVIQRDPIAIEEMPNQKHTWKYIVPAPAKQTIRQELSLVAFGRFQLFPELQILGESLRGL